MSIVRTSISRWGRRGNPQGGLERADVAPTHEKGDDDPVRRFHGIQDVHA
jgi:hypothetical protein